MATPEIQSVLLNKPEKAPACGVFVMEYEDIKIALEAAHVMADHFKEPTHVMPDLSVKRTSERQPEDRVLETIRPSEEWQV